MHGHNHGHARLATSCQYRRRNQRIHIVDMHNIRLLLPQELCHRPPRRPTVYSTKERPGPAQCHRANLSTTAEESDNLVAPASQQTRQLFNSNLFATGSAILIVYDAYSQYRIPSVSCDNPVVQLNRQCIALVVTMCYFRRMAR